MNSLVVEIEEARAQLVSVSEDSLIVDLMDGRTIIAGVEEMEQVSLQAAGAK